jgi:hypothetical protein
MRRRLHAQLDPGERTCALSRHPDPVLDRRLWRPVQNEDWGVPTLLWKTLTPEEKAAYEEADRRKAAADQQQRWNAMIGYYAPFCEQLGFAADTDPWRNCVLQRLMADEQGAMLPPTAPHTICRARW